MAVILDTQGNSCHWWIWEVQYPKLSKLPRIIWRSNRLITNTTVIFEWHIKHGIKQVMIAMT